MWTNVFVFTLCALVYAAAWWLVASGVLGALRAQTDELRSDGFLADEEPDSEVQAETTPADAQHVAAAPAALAPAPVAVAQDPAPAAPVEAQHTEAAHVAPAPAARTPEPAHEAAASAPEASAEAELPSDDFAARLDAGELAARTEAAAPAHGAPVPTETTSRSSSAPPAPDDGARESEATVPELVAEASASAGHAATEPPRAERDAHAPAAGATESDEVGTSDTRDAPRADQTSSPQVQQGHADMNSQPLDLPNWMEDSSGASARQTEPASLVPAAPSATSTPAPAPAIPSKPAASSTAPSTSASASHSSDKPVASGKGSASTLEPLRALSKIEKERMQCMSQLDTWARTWAEIEQRNAQACDELTRQVDALAQEHAGCEQRQRDTEARAKQEASRQASELQLMRSKLGELEPYVQQCLDLRQKCDGLGQDLKSAQKALDEQKQSAHAAAERQQSTNAELEKLRDQFARNQEAFKEATARELDWQKRYHEDTNKLMAQLTQKSQEHERAQGECQKAKAELEQSRQDHAAKDLSLQQSAQKYAELEQHCHSQQDALHERESRIQALTAELDTMRTAAAAQKKAQDEQMAVFHAAQSVLAELKPKLQMLENQLTPHS